MFNKQNIQTIIVLLFIFITIVSCKDKTKHSWDNKFIDFLSEQKIDVNKAVKIDTVHSIWLKDRFSGEKINSYSTSWGYLEAFDDIKHNKIKLVVMGPPPDHIWWNLISKYNIGIKLASYEFPDDGANGYHEVMWKYIEYKYGNDFFDYISKTADSIARLDKAQYADFMRNYKPKKMIR